MPSQEANFHPDTRAQLSAGARVVLGLSGGRDSVALLRLLKEQNCQIEARHIHHGIRGADADKDAAYCRQLCEEWSIPYAEIRLDIPQLAREQGKSLEHAARDERRRYLIAQARHYEAPLLLAHHADDQAESILFNLCRGAAGLRGMKARMTWQRILCLRPILHWRRRDITDYLQAAGIAWRDDGSNSSCEPTRNALRHRALPLLGDIMQRDIIPIINRSAELQQQSNAALAEALAQLPSRDPQGRLYLPYLRELSDELVSAILHQYLKEEGVSELSDSVVKEALQLVRGKGHIMNIAQGRRIRRREQRLFVEQQNP